MPMRPQCAAFQWRHGLYEERILPWLIHLAMRQGNFVPYRSRIASAASGTVLEIGIGSGLNLPFYGESVRNLIGLDPSPRLLAMAREAACRSPRPLELVKGTAEALPLENHSVDTVVSPRRVIPRCRAFR
jgi:ubiquinone/menaquinone biosynthesis C-methylase UbiE